MAPRARLETPSLPGGFSVGFVSDASFDSDPVGSTHNGIDNGETATFRVTGSTLDSFDSGGLASGVHVRSLIDASASLITTHAATVPVLATLAPLNLGLSGLALTRRRNPN